MSITMINIRCRKCGESCNLTGCRTCTIYPLITDTSRDATVKRIRAGLVKRSGKQWSVTVGRGTAGGWISISVPPKRLGCARLHDMDRYTDLCQACGQTQLRHDDENTIGCPGHVCTDKCYRAYITPEDREELGQLLSLTNVHFQGVSIASSIGHYVEYIDRAEGRSPRKYGEQYWD